MKELEEKNIEEEKKYKEKLRKFRTCGLQKNGEYSSENLVFKILRRNGYLEKLRGATHKILDKGLSMNQEEFQFAINLLYQCAFQTQNERPHYA